MTYPQTIQYLESLINYEKITAWPYKESLKLERIKDFLAAIDKPEDSLKCIHIAGTKGKGSTCAFLTYILRQGGYKVGLYTSPHFLDFRERIRILDAKGKRRQAGRDFEGMISKKELAQLVERLRPQIENYNQNSKYGPLSFFEVYTCLAFVYFREKKVDFAVLETGLGGRLDATNAVSPLVAAITSISYEHTQKLGNTLEEIAREKAGIIKNRLPLTAYRLPLIVISAPQDEEAMAVIRNRCKEELARLYEVNKDIFYEQTPKGFNVMGIFGEYPDLEIKLLGRHQLINATVAVGVAEVLRFHNIYVDIDSIRNGLYNTVWPGRCEVIAKNPLVVLDGAQNVASGRAIKETIKKHFKYKKLILVFGISADKDVKGVCAELRDLADMVILTRADNPRSTAPQKMVKYFPGKDICVTASVKQARQKANSIAEKEDLILVTGSLFVVGEFRNGRIQY